MAAADPKPGIYPSELHPSELNYQGVYPCPVCRHGQLTGLLMVEAFACNFCRHIFTANLTDQALRLEDSTQPYRWRWRGRRWQPWRLSADNPDLTLSLWLMAIALTILPPGLIWLSYHTFPPLPNDRWGWFPTVWMALVFLVHGVLVLFVLLEHYQFPLYVTLRLRLQQWQRQL